MFEEVIVCLDGSSLAETILPDAAAPLLLYWPIDNLEIDDRDRVR